ncbi:MAG: hypothetical protein RL226_1517 [Bacteroidota bacterium]|jgi:hypothetical protein
MEDNQQKGKLNIELPEQTADGVYSNLAIITHSPSEFVLDFIQVMPGMPKAKVRSRVIITPQHAKRLMRALQDNVRKFESQHGPIVETQSPDVAMPFGFGGPQGEA